MTAMHFTEYDTRVAAYALILDDADRILLTWWNGEGRATPGWSLPGGGVDYGESFEQGLLREVREEAGYDVVLGSVLLTDIYTGTRGPTTGRPFRSVRLVFEATIVGGDLGTTEVGGSTDYAAWLPLAEVTDQPSRAGILDLAVEAHRRRAG